MKSEDDDKAVENTPKDLRRAVVMMTWAAGAALALSALITGMLVSSWPELGHLVLMTVLSWLSAVMFCWRVVVARRGQRQGSVYLIDWSSRAISAERSCLVGTVLVIVLVFASVAAERLGASSSRPPDLLVPLVFGLFFGLPLVEMFVTKAREWRLFIRGCDPD